MKQIVINYLFVVGLPIVVGFAVRFLFRRLSKACLVTAAFAALALTGWIVANAVPANGSELYGILAAQATAALISSLLTGVALTLKQKRGSAGTK